MITAWSCACSYATTTDGFIAIPNDDEENYSRIVARADIGLDKPEDADLQPEAAEVAAPQGLPMEVRLFMAKTALHPVLIGML